MKKFICMLVIISLTIINVYGEEIDYDKTRVNIIVDGNVLDSFDEQQEIDLPAFIYDGRTMLPLKSTFEMFGIESNQITWDQVEKSVTVQSNDLDIIWMQINNPNVIVNGEVMTTDVPAKVFNNRTYVPLAFISKLLGEIPLWNSERKTVSMNPSQYSIFNNSVYFKMSRLLGYSVPLFQEDEGNYLIQKYSYDIGNSARMMTLSLSDLPLTTSFSELAAAYYLRTEDFNNWSMDKLIYYREVSEGNFLILVEVGQSTLMIESENVSLEILKRVAETIEEVK